MYQKNTVTNEYKWKQIVIIQIDKRVSWSNFFVAPRHHAPNGREVGSG